MRGRARHVGDHGSTTLTLRPRRARCRTCGVTQALLLTAVLPLRADTIAVIGTALLASARGVALGLGAQGAARERSLDLGLARVPRTLGLAASILAGDRLHPGVV